MRTNLAPPSVHPTTPHRGPLSLTPCSKAPTVTTAPPTGGVSQLFISTRSLDLFPCLAAVNCDRGDDSCKMKSISRLDIRHEASSAVDAFKVELCPKEQVHDRKVCPFYHNYRDRRRYPITYKAEQCPQHFEVDSNVMSCDKGDHCSKCHSRLELLYHPTIFKQRFCATWPNVSNCVRARQCAFAHDRSEINGKMFTEEQEARKGIDFFVNHFKTLWCPYGVQHDWHRCYYAHTYQDCRRAPVLGYGSEPCPYWSKSRVWSEYGSRCPHGHRCPYSHGSKEQLYHPSYYKTMPCCDWKSRGKCPRGELCAFYHHTSERRTSKRVTMLDYNQPLSIGDLLHEHQPHFWRPPLFSADDSTSMATRGIGRVRSYSSGTDSDASTVLPMVASTSSWGVHRSDSGSVTTTAPGSTELHPQLCSSYASIPIFILPPSVAYGPRQSEAVPEGEDHSVGGMAENDFRFVDEEDNTLDVRICEPGPSLLMGTDHSEVQSSRILETTDSTDKMAASPPQNVRSKAVGSWREGAQTQIDIFCAGEASGDDISSTSFIFDAFCC